MLKITCHAKRHELMYGVMHDTNATFGRVDIYILTLKRINLTGTLSLQFSCLGATKTLKTLNSRTRTGRDHDQI